MSKHTPGPWGLSDIGPCIVPPNGIVIRGAKNGWWVAVACTDSNEPEDRMSIEERDANARLMKTAPKLLDACNLALAAITNPQAFETEQVRANIRAAIDEAEGK